MNIDKNSPDSPALNFDAPEASSAPVTELPSAVPAVKTSGPAASSPAALRAALPKIPQQITISFDIGHSSIGWAVFGETKTEISGEFAGASYPDLLGAGTVLFEKDGCLASQRRAHRRVRRNIAARRQRVARLKRFLLSLGVISKEDADANPTAFPWLLAARVLASDGKEKLSWPQLWCVLRWYAHNRGYDGNALWAGDSADADDEEGVPEEDKEDTKKLRNAAALALMRTHGTKTMAETICAVLGCAPQSGKTSSNRYFKGENAAFPRDVVRGELHKILEAHIGVLPQLDEGTTAILVGNFGANARRDSVPAELRKALRLPARFVGIGGLLFGQTVPRFDNRTIGKCRITGKNVPLKSCREFLLYRWARALNNFTVFTDASRREIRTLTPREREALTAKISELGFFGKKTLNDALRDVSGCAPANTEKYFLTEEMEDALVLDPVRKLIATNSVLAPLWPYFSSHGKKIFAAQLAAGKTLRLGNCAKQMSAWGDWPDDLKSAFYETLETLEAAAKAKAEKNAAKKSAKKAAAPKKINLAGKVFSASLPSGRASYCREILKKVYDEALAGTDSTMEGGCLYETPEIRARLLGVPATSENSPAGTDDAEIQKWLAAQTNNHLVRHRMLIFSRLLKDIVADYAGGNAELVKNVVVEVVRDLAEFSGLSAQEIAGKLKEKTANFNDVAKMLDEAAAASAVPVVMTAGLLRKARLLKDQKFTCPYTGKKIGFPDLFGGRLDIEHIIPRSLRASDALSSCVMTFAEVNRMKGQRTAKQFIREFGGKKVDGMDIDLLTPEKFEKWIEDHKKQKLARGFTPEDRERCKRRAELLLLEKYDERNADFTSRDLTQTSHLNKLAIRVVKRELGKEAMHLAGAVTGFVRKNLNLLECLSAAVPRIQEKAASLPPGEKLLKADFRDLTHLHHALDAVTQGLTGILFDKGDWKLLAKRKLDERDRDYLRNKYPSCFSFSEKGVFKMNPLPKPLIQKIIARLRERRVVQHVPVKMDGMRVEQTTWSIVGESTDKNGKVTVSLRQHKVDIKPGRYDKDGKRPVKDSTEKPSLLLGYSVPAGKESKLKAIKGVVKIRDNYGAALDPTPTVIPFFKVHEKLRALRERNGGKFPRILRKGMLISVPAGTYKGTWKIFGVQDNAASGALVNIVMPDRVKEKESGKPDSKENVFLKTLIKDGMKILKTRLTGTPTEE